MFDDFDFSVLDDPDYKEDAVREDILSPFLKALGFRPSGRQRMQRSQSLLHPFVLIGSQKRKVNIVPDYTLWSDDQAVLVIDAKRPSEALVRSHHVEQAFSYAIHPDVRVKSFALCNGRELVLYDIDKSEPVFQVKMDHLRDCWTEVLKHLSPVALLNHRHRQFQGDLGTFLKGAGFTASQELTFHNSRISSIGRLVGDGITATAGHEMADGIGFQGSFDMPDDALPILLSCLPPNATAMVTKALQTPDRSVLIGGVIEVAWTVQLGKPDVGLYQHDPLIPLIVKAVLSVSMAAVLGPPPAGLPHDVMYLPSLLSYL